jgi:2-polyprenyl-3-methyl-5-hydroxy-6-metoxy-1,4-benzoquinol methylase
MGDRRGFFYNLLNRPIVFNTLRSILDGGQVGYVARILENAESGSVLDVCCGCGAFSRVPHAGYTGIDYNENFIRHARRKYGSKGVAFRACDIRELDLRRRYDVSMLINSLHHFSDSETLAVLTLMREVTRGTVLIHDLAPRKGFISKFFYAIDRGEYVRTVQRQEELLSAAGLNIRKRLLHRTFPGIYVHSSFLCTPGNPPGSPDKRNGVMK